jgi:hypothetical protein
MSVMLECIGCREMKEFTEEVELPLCHDCKKWEMWHHHEIYDEPVPTNQEMLAMNLDELGAWFALHDRPVSEVYRKLNGYKKKPIPEDLRWMVWERDNFTCRDCGSRKHLTVDHIVPEVVGGEATMENCQTLCKSCNSRKGAR